MTARTTVATLCLVAALAAGPDHAAAQSGNASPTILQTAQVPEGVARERGGSVRLDVPAPQPDPIVLALFGAAVVGLGLFLRRYVAD